MHLKHRAISQLKILLLLTGIFLSSYGKGQLVPSKPASYPVFSPVLLNPGIAGSRDFADLNLLFRANNTPGAQMVSYHSRLMKSGSGSSFTPFGVGGYVYQDHQVNSRTLSAGAMGAYHLSIGAGKSRGISIGLAAKGMYTLITEDGESIPGAANTFVPNADLGIYYYGPNAFAGITGMNLLSEFLGAESLAGGEVVIDREQFFYGGLKLLLSRANEIVIEPSLVVNLSDSLTTAPLSNIRPYLKIYVQNACFGATLRDLDHLAFFLQYQFPRFYSGVFIELPRNEMLIRGNQYIIDLTLGMHLGSSDNKRSYRW